MIYGQRTFGSGIFGEEVESLEASRTISYFYRTLISREADLPYKFTLEVSSIDTIPYSFIANISKIGTIRYEYLSNVLSIEVYGSCLFGEGIFGGRIEGANEVAKSIKYGYKTLLSKDFDILYNWGIGVEKEETIPYQYKYLVPLVGELPYRFTLTTSEEKRILYGYGNEYSQDFSILYSYGGAIAKIRTIRYNYKSLDKLFQGMVRKITITATPKGQVAKIELERR